MHPLQQTECQGACNCYSEIVGVYVGGPPIVGQRELFIASIKIKNSEIAEVFNNKKQEFLKFKKYYHKNLFKKFSYSKKLREYYEKSQIGHCGLLKTELITKITDLIYQAVVKYKHPEEFISYTLTPRFIRSHLLNNLFPSE